MFAYRWSDKEARHYRVRLWKDGQSILDAESSLSATGEPEPIENDEVAGSGFVISSDGLVVTCAHLVQSAKFVIVDLGNKKPIAKVIAIDTDHDLAVLQVTPEYGLIPVPLEELGLPLLDEQVMAIGHSKSDGQGNELNVTTGSVAEIVNRPSRAEFMKLDILNRCSAGSPVINNRGNVVGIVLNKNLMDVSDDSVGIACPVEPLRKLIEWSGLQPQGMVSSRTQSAESPQKAASLVEPSVVLVRAYSTLSTRFQKVELSETTGWVAGRFECMLSVNGLGHIRSNSAGSNLPFALGATSDLFFQPMDDVFQSHWKIERTGLLQSTDPSRSPRTVPFPSELMFPIGRTNKASSNPIPSIPVEEKLAFSLVREEANILHFDRKYLLQSTDNATDPAFKMEGTGTWQFDIQVGCSHAIDYQFTVTKKGESPVSLRLKCERRSNEEMVATIVEELKKAGLTSSSRNHIIKLSTIKVVDARKKEVLEILESHLAGTDRDPTPYALEAYCQWSDASCENRLIKTLESNPRQQDLPMILAAIGRLKNPAHIPIFAMHLSSLSTEKVSERALEVFGMQAEEALLDLLESKSKAVKPSQVIRLLARECGGAKSLESFYKLDDPTLRSEISMAKILIEKRIGKDAAVKK
jgi:hypothetical protein